MSIKIRARNEHNCRGNIYREFYVTIGNKTKHMKSISTIFAFLIMTTFTFGQDLLLKSYVEQTIVGPKVGTSVGFMVMSGIEVGGFYQKAVDGAAPEGANKWNFEEQFYGAFFTYPVVNKRTFDLGFNVRTGVSNGENFVITPSLLASISPIRSVKIGAGVGIRGLRPTLQGSIAFRIHRIGSGS